MLRSNIQMWKCARYSVSEEAFLPLCRLQFYVSRLLRLCCSCELAIQLRYKAVVSVGSRCFLHCAGRRTRGTCASEQRRHQRSDQDKRITAVCDAQICTMAILFTDVRRTRSCFTKLLQPSRHTIFMPKLGHGVFGSA